MFENGTTMGSSGPSGQATDETAQKDREQNAGHTQLPGPASSSGTKGARSSAAARARTASRTPARLQLCTPLPASHGSRGAGGAPRGCACPPSQTWSATAARAPPTPAQGAAPAGREAASTWGTAEAAVLPAALAPHHAAAWDAPAPLPPRTCRHQPPATAAATAASVTGCSGCCTRAQSSAPRPARIRMVEGWEQKVAAAWGSVLGTCMGAHAVLCSILQCMEGPGLALGREARKGRLCQRWCATMLCETTLISHI